MKIRFWRLAHFGGLIGMLTYPVLEAISNYVKTSNIDFFLFWITVAVCLIYFIPIYFSYILEVADNFIIIKNGIFQKAIKIEFKIIKAIKLVIINNNPVSITITLQNDDEIPWFTQDRTQDIYNKLLEYTNSRWKADEST